MKLESPAFTATDLDQFLDEILLADARNTAARLRAAGERMRELAARIPETPEAGDAWNAKEVLAHIAVVARAYGVFAYMVATGRLTELKLTDVITQRDPFGEEMAARSVSEIVEEAAKQHQRTLAFLERATAEQLLRKCETERGPVTPEYLIRLPLVAHTEDHLDQLERALG